MADEKKEAIKLKLLETRQDLLQLAEALDETSWETPVFSEENSWTAADLLRHMTDSEGGMTALMVKIRKTGEGVPADFDRNRWNARSVAKVKDKTPAELLEMMAQNRLRLFQFIDELQDEDWSKEGRHASLRILSIEQICHLIADHEREHTAELRRMVQL